MSICCKVPLLLPLCLEKSRMKYRHGLPPVSASHRCKSPGVLGHWWLSLLNCLLNSEADFSVCGCVDGCNCCWAEKQLFVVCWGCMVWKGRSEKDTRCTEQPLGCTVPKAEIQVASHVLAWRTVCFSQRAVQYSWLWAGYFTCLHLGFHPTNAKTKQGSPLCSYLFLLLLWSRTALFSISEYTVIEPGLVLSCPNNACLSVWQLEFLKKSWNAKQCLGS